jgi:hypothetical protein
MKRCIGVAAGVARLLFRAPGARRATAQPESGVATGITAASLLSRQQTRQPREGARMRLRVIIVALVAVAAAVALVGPSAGAKPKPVKPGQSFTQACPSGHTALGGTVEWYDKDNQLIGTSPGRVTGASTVTFGPAPKKTVTAVVTELNCQPPDPTIHLTGSRTFPTDGEPRPIYVVDPADAEILGARSCPSGSTLDYDASTIVVPDDVELINQLDSTGSIIVWLPYIDLDPDFNGIYDERTVTYDFACIPG